jgi:hypothetical protein
MRVHLVAAAPAAAVSVVTLAVAGSLAIAGTLLAGNSRVAAAQDAGGIQGGGGINEGIEGIAGPYRVSVEVVPAEPVAGKVQFLVRPVELSTGHPLTGARVDVVLGRDGRDELITPALAAPTNPGTYVGNAEPDQAGEWTIRVEVAASAGEGEFSFPLAVHPRARSGRGLAAPTLVYAGAAVVILCGVAWLVRESRRARQTRSRL